MPDKKEKTEQPQEAYSAAETEPVIDAEILNEEESTDTPRPSQKAESPKKRNWTARIGWAVALLLGAFVAGLWSFPYLKTPLAAIGLIAAQEATAVPSRLNALENRLANAESEIRKLQEVSRTANAATTPDTDSRTDVLLAELKAQSRRLDAAAARLSQLEKREVAGPASPQATAEARQIMEEALMDSRTALAQIEGEVGAIAARVAALETREPNAAPRSRLALALADLAHRARDGEPVANALDILAPDIMALSPEVLTQAEPAYRSLVRLLATPVSGRARLMESFSGYLNAALRARDKAEGSFLAGLVTVRKLDASDDPDDRILNEAENLVKGAQFAAAASRLEKLRPEMASAFAPWLQDVRRHMAATEGFHALISAVAGEARP